MIVRDAAGEIGPCLDSALPHIDRWCIVDTGSKDGTVALVQERLGHLPGKVHKRKWRSFRENRTQLIDLARKSGADYLLTLDADCTLHHDGPLPPLTTYCYGGRVRSKYSYSIPVLLKASEAWEWRGVAHCYLHREGGYSQVDLPGLELEDRGHPSPGKIERDLELLSAEHARNPLDARTVFYLAQTYWDLGRWAESAAFYRMRAEMAGFAEETFFARYRLGVILSEHFDAKEGLAELVKAWQMRPSRAEPLRAISNIAENVANKMREPEGDVLFVTRTAYGRPASKWDDWRAKYETLDVTGQQAAYDEAFAEDRNQARFDDDTLRAFLDHIGRPVSVVELGGWDGELAAAIFARTNGQVRRWRNYEISPKAVEATVCNDDRYQAEAPEHFYWETRHEADLFVASHVIEHLSLDHVRATLDATDCRYVFLQAPLDDGPTDWTGYDGGHVLEVGWTGLTDELEARGFASIPSLAKPTVRCYQKGA